VDRPARHQLEELPPISARVIEHRCQRLRCPDCGRRTRGQLPAELAKSSFGPRLQAAVATVSVRNRVSRADAVELCEELFGARISSGAVDAILARASDALEKPYGDVLARVRSAKALNVDETGWRTAGERRALWGAFTPRHAFFAIASDRHEDRRDFAAHAEGLAVEKEFGEVGLELCERVFWAWEVFAHTSDRRELRRAVHSLQRTYKPIIRSFAAKRARNKRCRGMARNLLKAWPALWTFAGHTGVEPTNNHAERALRGAVIYRKLSLGSQSERGELRTSRLLSAHTTCRLQRRSLFAYLTDAIVAHARGDPVPLLT